MAASTLPGRQRAQQRRQSLGDLIRVALRVPGRDADAPSETGRLGRLLSHLALVAPRVSTLDAADVRGTFVAPRRGSPETGGGQRRASRDATSKRWIRTPATSLGGRSQRAWAQDLPRQNLGHAPLLEAAPPRGRWEHAEAGRLSRPIHVAGALCLRVPGETVGRPRRDKAKCRGAAIDQGQATPHPPLSARGRGDQPARGT